MMWHSSTYYSACSHYDALVLCFIFYGIQGNEVYDGSEFSAGIFLHRSSDDAIVKGRQPSAKRYVCILQCHTKTYVVAGHI